MELVLYYELLLLGVLLYFISIHISTFRDYVTENELMRVLNNYIIPLLRIFVYAQSILALAAWYLGQDYFLYLSYLDIPAVCIIMSLILASHTYRFIHKNKRCDRILDKILSFNDYHGELDDDKEEEFFVKKKESFITTCVILTIVFILIAIVGMGFIYYIHNNFYF